MVANSVIEFRADPDAKFIRLYLLLLTAAFENGQSCESRDDLSITEPIDLQIGRPTDKRKPPRRAA